jgi:uncharacterized protein YbcV (DUF1398 family)
LIETHEKRTLSMNDHQKSVAAECLSAAHDDSLSFPDIVGRLIEAGFESYSIDFRRQTATYYLPSGDSLVLPAGGDDTPIATSFDSGAIKDAIREAQNGSAAYSYQGFCRKVRKAGCVGYIVSFTGRRALYFGRTAETHVEYFPS